jgi:hypothetical protein
MSEPTSPPPSDNELRRRRQEALNALAQNQPAEQRRRGQFATVRTVTKVPLWLRVGSVVAILVLVVDVVLLDGSSMVDSPLRLDPDLATGTQIPIALDRLIHESKRSETTLIIGLIQAIEEVLKDCSREQSQAPGGTHDWSQATQD